MNDITGSTFVRYEIVLVFLLSMVKFTNQLNKVFFFDRYLIFTMIVSNDVL